MLIPPPPISNTNLEKCLFDFIQKFNGFFIDINFDHRYFPRFEWFTTILQDSKLNKILNIGCGGGRETFALLWKLKANKAFGIDKKFEKSAVANDIVESIINFKNVCMPSIRRLRSLPKEYHRELQKWYSIELPSELRNDILPEFYSEDFSKTKSQLTYQFDLIYSRYVLHCAEDDGDDISALVDNLVRVIMPQVGKIVIVEPTVKGDKNYNFLPFFCDAGLKRIGEEITDVHILGGIDKFSDKGEVGEKPRGWIFYKP